MSNQTKALWKTAQFVAIVFAITFGVMAILKFVPIDIVLVGFSTMCLIYLIYAFYKFNLEHFNRMDEIEKIRSK